MRSTNIKHISWVLFVCSIFVYNPFVTTKLFFPLYEIISARMYLSLYHFAADIVCYIFAAGLRPIKPSMTLWQLLCICDPSMRRNIISFIILQLWFPIHSDEVYSILWRSRIPWLSSLCRRPEPKQFCFCFHILWLSVWDW